MNGAGAGMGLASTSSWFNTQMNGGEENIVRQNLLTTLSQMSVADSGEVLDELRLALQLTPPPSSSTSRGRLPDTVLHLGDESPTSSTAESDVPGESQPGVHDGGEDPATPDDPTTAVRGEIRRLRALMQNREVQRIVTACLRVLPFVLIVIAKLLVERFWSISALLSSQCIFLFADTQLVRSLQSNAKLPLIKAQLSTLIFFFIIAFIFGLADVSVSLSFSPPSPDSIAFNNAASFFSTLFWVLITDYTAKIIDIQLKIWVSFMPAAMIAQKRRRRILQCIEYSTQLYRHWLPVRAWILYLRSSQDPSFFVAIVDLLLTLTYVIFKVYFGIRPFRLWLCSCRYVCRLRSLGSNPTRSEISAEPNCSICCGEYQAPIKLSCGHVFCEECISTWLDKEHTCPMCRKKVAQEDNEWKCGSTALMPQIF